MIRTALQESRMGFLDAGEHSGNAGLAGQVPGFQTCFRPPDRRGPLGQKRDDWASADAIAVGSSEEKISLFNLLDSRSLNFGLTRDSISSKIGAVDV